MNIPRTKEGYIEYSYGGCKSRFHFTISSKKLLNFVIFSFMNTLKTDKNSVSRSTQLLKMTQNYTFYLLVFKIKCMTPVIAF